MGKDGFGKRDFGKRGSEKYYIIISIILGLIVLGLSLYYIFQEYFNQEAIDWEACRQSVLLRSQNAPNIVKIGQEKAFPFKCKTQVITIDFKDYDKAGKLIMDTMAQCWYLFDGGKMNLFSSNYLSTRNKCFICARIHFTDGVKDYYIAGSSKLPPTIAYDEAEIFSIVHPNSYDPYEQLIKSRLTSGDSPVRNLARTELNENLKKVQDMKKSISSKIDDLKKNENLNKDKIIFLENGFLTYIDEFISNTNKILDSSSLNNDLVYLSKDYKRVTIIFEQEKNRLYNLYISTLYNYEIGSTNTGNFHWNNYFSTKMSNSDKTYGEYIYGWNDPNEEGILPKDTFKDMKCTEKYTLPEIFDVNKGDLLINVIFSYDAGITAFYNKLKGEEMSSHFYSFLVPHQPNDPVTCDIETIPA